MRGPPTSNRLFSKQPPVPPSPNQRLFTLPPALRDQLLLPLNFLAASYFSPSSGQNPDYQFHRLASPSPAAAPLPIPAANCCSSDQPTAHVASYNSRCLGQLAAALAALGGDFYGNGNEGGGKGKVFPKLKKLHFESISNCEEWKLTKEDGEVLPSLDKLFVCYCEKLKSLPNYLPNTLRRVEIVNCNQVIWAPDNSLPLLEDLYLIGDVRGILGKRLPCLPALKKLHIWGISIESLPSNGWGFLESLNTLDICECDRLASLPSGLGQLPALQTVCVDDCSELRSLFDGFERLKSLH
ncbi:hypothetical protein MRB53_028612 [Persea americana]|uniref:Uncharacterized protein n=1 Tax=Persea americana TaxID=3435 RepID=A0ACC2KGN2_PERAE|nr:hypothetical protein MRB53_028612 [Persea americana]